MSTPGGSSEPNSENTDPINATNKENSSTSSQSNKRKQRQKKKKELIQKTEETLKTRNMINPFDMKQMSMEVKRLSDSGKLFNVMREIERRGGVRGFQDYCSTRGKRGGGRRGKEKEEEEVELDQPSTSGIKN